MRSKGFSSVELMMAVVVAGMILLLGWPRLRVALTKSDVRTARTALITLYHQARNAALESSRVATLNFNSAAAWITAAPRLDGAAGVDTVGQVQNFTALYGVTVSASPSTTLTVDPRGFGGGGTTVRLSRAGYTDSIVVSGYGRIVK